MYKIYADNEKLMTNYFSNNEHYSRFMCVRLIFSKQEKEI